MAYGITIENDNANIQIDSDTTNVGLVVLGGAASSTTVASFNQSTQFLFAKPAGTYAQQHVALTTTGSWTAASSYTFIDEDGNSVAMDYLIATWADEASASTSGYGLQIYNSTGDLAYDSVLYTGYGGLGIVGVSKVFTLDGYGAGSTGSRLTTDPDQYVNMNGTYSTGADFFVGYVFRTATTNNGPGIYWDSYIDIDLQEYGIIRSNYENFSPRYLAEGGSV